MAIPRIVSLRDPVETSTSEPAADKLLAGQPRHQLANHYADSRDQFFCGYWSSTRGKWRVSYSEHELCHMIEGRVAIVSSEGERWEFGPGDAFVVPSGFTGTWEVLEDCRKLYAIYEPK